LFEIFRIISKKRFEFFEVFEKINSPDMVFLTTDLAQTKLPILKSSWRKTINCDQSWTRDELIGGGAVQCSVTLWLHWTINIETFPNLFFHEAPCIQLRNYMGCLMEFYTSLTLFYSKMSFKILKFSNRPSFFFPSNLLYPTGKLVFTWWVILKNKYEINLCTRLKLFWVHQLGSIRDHTLGYKLK
jgi:hypothetical protein